MEQNQNQNRKRSQNQSQNQNINQNRNRNQSQSQNQNINQNRNRNQSQNRNRNRNQNQTQTIEASRARRQARKEREVILARNKKKAIRIGILSLICIMVSLGIVATISKYISGYGDKDIEEEIDESKPYTVIIDPGHGGNDTGASGIIDEVDIIEKTTRALVELFEADERFEIILTKTYDEYMTVNDRNYIIKDFNPDVMISIHANSNEDSSAAGFECYPSPPGQSNYVESMYLASYISEEMGNLGIRLRGENGIRYCYYVPVEGHSNRFEKTFKEASDNKIYNYDTYGVLTGMSFPSVLVEQCFITNQSDVNKYYEGNGASDCANAYYNAIVRYLENLELLKELEELEELENDLEADSDEDNAE